MFVSMPFFFCQFVLNCQIVIIMSCLILLTRFICTTLLKLTLTSSKHGLLQTEVKPELKQWIWNFWEMWTYCSHRTEEFNIYAINEVRWHHVGSLGTLVPPTPLPATVTLLVALWLFFYPEDGTSRFFLDSGNYPPDYTASQPRRL
jgi:hypothetical protein